jgi:YjbE family integral membrane protein
MDLNWAAIIKIIGIDIMLGVDNAIVIALACASLPVALRSRAVLIGTAGAIGLRAILLLFAGFLMGLVWVKLIAGAYLIYIGYSLLRSNSNSHDIQPATSMFGAIQTIIIADFMMSLDNVLAVTAAAQSAGEHSTLYAVAGILFSIPIIIFGAHSIMRLMGRYPIIIWIGAGLLGWVGAEMILFDPMSQMVLSWLTAYIGEWTHITIKITGFLLVIGAAY